MFGWDPPVALTKASEAAGPTAPSSVIATTTSTDGVARSVSGDPSETPAVGAGGVVTGCAKESTVCPAPIALSETDVGATPTIPSGARIGGEEEGDGSTAGSAEESASGTEIESVPIALAETGAAATPTRPSPGQTSMVDGNIESEGSTDPSTIRATTEITAEAVSEGEASGDDATLPRTRDTPLSAPGTLSFAAQPSTGGEDSNNSEDEGIDAAPTRIAPASTTAQVTATTFGGQAISAVSDGVVVGSQTLTPGVTPVTVSEVVYELNSGGQLIAANPITLGRGQDEDTSGTTTINGEVVSWTPGAFFVDGSTITATETAATIAGNVNSVQTDEAVVVQSVTTLDLSGTAGDMSGLVDAVVSVASIQADGQNEVAGAEGTTTGNTTTVPTAWTSRIPSGVSNYLYGENMAGRPVPASRLLLGVSLYLGFWHSLA